jgi:hypothetical protein
MIPRTLRSWTLGQFDQAGVVAHIVPRGIEWEQRCRIPSGCADGEFKLLKRRIYVPLSPGPSGY